MSKYKVGNKDLLSSKRVTNYLFIKTSVNIYSLPHLNRILVIWWQKNKKRKQETKSSEINAKTFLLGKIIKKYLFH